ncbi:uncharacterized protein BXZ73DRAFT_50156, partial [Epithele typhae]|uniref:uncharacterized protein n=1 Tax=Epithele typhae TaxID=378194 RepID=UPI0020078416
LTIAHTNGFHRLSVSFCKCTGHKTEDIQLLEMGYYPGSQNRPRSAFTFQCLDGFLTENRVCKTSPFSFHSKLCHMTNENAPHWVPMAYKALLRTSRQWRNLQHILRSGFAHRKEPAGPGDMAIKCPACPRPGVNLPDGWERDKTHPYKYMPSFVLDGDFTVQGRLLTNPENSLPFADGEMFSVADGPFQEHLEKERNEPSTCNAHRASFPGLLLFLVIYDVACQYYINLRKRFARRQSYMPLPSGLLLLFGIGQFHIHGHRAQCFSRFSPNFVTGAGMQDGEVIDDHMQYSNWLKLIRMGVSLLFRP